ncbi:MAG: hypothetical protein AAGI38_00290 [Bacteroidota bacterium]
MNTRIVLVLLSIALMLTVGCGSDSDEPAPQFSNVPEIELLSVSPGSIQALTDSLVFEIKYTDGDGDLGTTDDKVRNLFIVDTRIDVTHEFRIPLIVPNEGIVSITGTFRVNLGGIILKDPNATSEEVIFNIYLVDRAGNQSNEIESPAVTITR